MLQVTNSYVERLYKGGGTKYDPARHMLVEGRWVEAARRKTGKDIILYYHRLSKKWVVAMWIVKPDEGLGPGLVMELETLDMNPDAKGGEWQISTSYLMARVAPTGNVIKDMERKMDEEWRREVWENDQENRERKDVAKHLERKGPRYRDVADQLARGEMPWVGSDTAYRAQVEAWKELLK